MKSISKESVEDIAHFLLQRLDAKLNQIENHSKEQQTTLKTLKHDTFQMDKDLKGLHAHESYENFLIQSSISGSLRAYIKNKMNSDESIKTYRTSTTDIETVENSNNEQHPKQENEKNLLCERAENQDNSVSIHVKFNYTPEKTSKMSATHREASGQKENVDVLKRLGLGSPAERGHCSRLRNLSNLANPQEGKGFYTHRKNAKSSHSFEKSSLNKSASETKRKY